MVQTVPLLDYWKDGLSPPDLQAQVAQQFPERVVFCGGADPLHQGVRGAIREMERQSRELGARSFKFYQAQSRSLAWRADDPAIAYPLFQKALDLGVTFIQFHKGLPLGDQNLEDLRALDIQQAALDFPDLQHLGSITWGTHISTKRLRLLRGDQTWCLYFRSGLANILVQPRRMIKILGQALFDVGPDRILYGSEAFLWPRVQTLIDTFFDLEMPEDLQEGYGYPPLDRGTKAMIFGENLARILELDIGEKLRELSTATQ